MKKGKSKILIIGGAGYIGTHVLVELLHAELDVLVIDNFENSFTSSLKKVSKIVSNQFNFLNVDITNVKLLDKVFKNFIPDVIFHLAGKKNLTESSNFPMQYYQSNVNGLINVLSKMDEYGCNKIILSSSAAIYGEPKKIPISEKSLVSPMSVYARTKFFIEEITKDWSTSNDNKKAIILRYFNPVGNHESGEIGENSKLEQNNLFPSIVKVFENKGQYFNIYGNNLKTQDGTAIRDFIHVSDLAKAHIYSLNYIDNVKNNEVFNIGSGVGTSIKEVINIFEKHLKVSIPVKIKKSRTGEAPISIASIKRAKNYLNWYPVFNLEKAIKDLIKWKSKST